MRLWLLLFLLIIPFIAILHAFAIEVVINPYDDIDYENINIYTFFPTDEPECNCHGQEEFDFTKW